MQGIKENLGANFGAENEGAELDMTRRYTHDAIEAQLQAICE